MALWCTAGTAGYLGTLLAGLATPIAFYRIKNNISLGIPEDPKHSVLECMVRAHSNAAEFVPIFLIMLGACENTQALPKKQLAIVAGTYCVLRTMQSVAIARPNLLPKPCRAIGFLGGIATIVGLGGILMFKAAKNL